MFVLGVLVFPVFLFVFVLVMLDAIMLAKSRGVFSAFVGSIGFRFGAIGGAARFDFLGFFFGESGDFRGMRFFRFVFGFIFFEFCPTDDGIYFDFFGGLLVLGLDEVSSECGDLVLAQFGFAASCRFVRESRSVRIGKFERRSLVPRGIRTVRRERSVFRCTDIFFGGNGRCLGFGTRVGEEPARKAAGEAPGNVAGAGSACRRMAGCALRRFFGLGRSFVRLALDDWRRSSRGNRFVPVFCERFTRQKNALLSAKIIGSFGAVGGIGWSGVA